LNDIFLFYYTFYSNLAIRLQSFRMSNAVSIRLFLMSSLYTYFQVAF
jgi:hypothetical protein